MLLSQYKKCSCQDNDKCDICQLFDSIDKEEKVSNEKYSIQIISILYKNLFFNKLRHKKITKYAILKKREWYR